MMFRNLFLGTAYLFFVTISAIVLNRLEPGAGIFFGGMASLCAFIYILIEFLND